MGVTIQDIAADAGVSVSTVSRVINGSSSVSEEKRERVLTSIKRNHFHPSAAARSLIGALVTHAPPRTREAEAERARQRSLARFGSAPREGISPLRGNVAAGDEGEQRWHTPRTGSGSPGPVR